MAETPDPQAARNVRFIELEESCKRSTTGQLKAKIASQGKSAGGLKGKSALIERVMSNEGFTLADRESAVGDGDITGSASALPPDVKMRHHGSRHRAVTAPSEESSRIDRIIAEAPQLRDSPRREQDAQKDGPKSLVFRVWVLRLSWCGIALAILLYLRNFLLPGERLVQTEWTLHTGSPQHMTSRADIFQPYADSTLTSQHFGSDALEVMGCKAVGSVTLVSRTTSQTHQVLDDVLYCSESSTQDLLSIGQLAEQGMEWWHGPEGSGKRSVIVFGGGSKFVAEKDVRNVFTLKAEAVRARSGILFGAQRLARGLWARTAGTIQNA